MLWKKKNQAKANNDSAPSKIKITKSTIVNPMADSPYKTFVIKLVLLSIFVVILMFLYQIKTILMVLFFALFLNMLFSPLLNRFNKWKIPDVLGIIIIYIIAFVFIMIALFAIIPIFVKQFAHLATMIQNWFQWVSQIYNESWLDWFDMPIFVKEFLIWTDITEIFKSLEVHAWEITKFIWDKFKNVLSSGFWFISSVTSSIASLVLLVIFTFFIALERHNIRQFFYDLLPVKWEKYFLQKEPAIVKSISDWFKTQWILWLAIFVMTYLGLYIIKIFWVDLEWKFTLALIAWMMEFVPYLWPVLSAIPALIIALWISYKAAIVVLILYVIIQQSENNLLVPYIMWKSLSLSPFAVLVWMTVWASIFWIIWIIIAIPIVAVIQIFVDDYIERKK